MKDFIIKRWAFEWITEFFKSQSDQEKLRHIELILECMEPLKDEGKLDKEAFYCGHVERRSLLKIRRRKRYCSIAAKAAVFLLVFMLSAQVICYAITGKSIFRYINKKNEKTTEVQIEINDPSGESPADQLIETIKGFVARNITKDNGAESGTNFRVSTWEEVKNNYKRDVMYPRYMPRGWRLQNILVNVLDKKVIGIIASYSRGEAVLYYSYYDHSGTTNGSEKILFGEEKTKVKILKVAGGEFSFYKGDRTLSVLGHVNQFEMNIEGMISIYEAEKIAKYIK